MSVEQKKNNPVGLDAGSNRSRPSPQGKQGLFSNSSQSQYFRISKQKPVKTYVCTCSMCYWVGSNHIIQQYSDFKDLLIEDRDKRIFDPFVEKVEGF